MREVRKSFESGYDPKLNWLFVGVDAKVPLYGSNLSLDEIEEIIKEESDFSDPINGKYLATVLIVHARIPAVKYGEVMVSAEDIDWLRGIVRGTLEAINEGQEGNV